MKQHNYPSLIYCTLFANLVTSSAVKYDRQAKTIEIHIYNIIRTFLKQLHQNRSTRTGNSFPVSLSIAYLFRYYDTNNTKPLLKLINALWVILTETNPGY